MHSHSKVLIEELSKKLYTVLAEIGYFPKEALLTLRQAGSILQGHPDMRKTPGVEMSTGSLGNGLSVGIGMALGAKLAKKDYHTCVLIGDGEVDEGEILNALDKAKQVKGRPTIIIAHTVKGKGISFMEGKFQWHGKAPNKEEYEIKHLGIKSLEQNY